MIHIAYSFSCLNCNSIVSPLSPYCTKCNTENKFMFCENCGVINKQMATHCNECKIELESIAKYFSIKVPQEIYFPIKECRICGLADKEKKCSKCGAIDQKKDKLKFELFLQSNITNEDKSVEMQIYEI
eukprot:TRINITY_DN15634_c0_g1_i1.p1 TRINITY_DN15634_c0_g1~~TRINITY_DN15634_c0_g1_i1.p1  ORF type:complete len:129 (+),score=25.65 TRINITY_DN15634_c0_g1_i1:3-389(+)